MMRSTRHKSPNAVVKFFPLILLAILFVAGQSTAQEEFFTPAPDEYRIFGNVKDEQGQPIADATASIVTLPIDYYDNAGYLLKSPPVSLAKCDEEGSFDIRIPGDDPRWNAVNKWTQHLLLVQAPGFQTSVTKFTRSRMLVRLPLNVTVKESSTWKLKILAADQTPVTDVEIRQAVISRQALPYKLDLLAPAKNLGNGVFEFQETPPASLDAVYVCDQKSGFNFRLAVHRGKDTPVVRLPKTGVANCRFELPNDTDETPLVGKPVCISTGRLYLQGDSPPSPVSWTVKNLNESLTVQLEHAIFGSVIFYMIETNSVPFASSDRDLAAALTLTPENSPLDVIRKIYPAKTFRLKFVDQSGEAVKRVYGQQVTAKSTTVAPGTIALQFPVREKPSGQVFPFDATHQYQITDPFGVHLEGIKVINGEPEPIEMTRSRSVRGIVVDANDQPVVGAKVEYRIKRERFTETSTVLSDVSGNFQIDGLPANTTVSLAAKKDNLATAIDANISVKSGQLDEVVIPVFEQPSAAVTGTITDQNGQPLFGATVKLFRASVSEEEGWGEPRYGALDLIPDFAGVTTDSSGRFEYPATTDFANRLQILVTADGYRELRSPFIDGQQKKIANGAFDLGKFSLFKTPGKKNSTITVSGSTGQKIDNAKLVFFGVDSQKKIVRSDAHGMATVELENTPQLVAVRADGYELKLLFLDQIPAEISLTLEQHNGKPKLLAWMKRDWRHYHEQSRSLLAKLETPKPKKSTFYRQSLFFKSQVATDLETFRKTIINPGYQYQQYLLQFNSLEIFFQSPDEAVDFLETRLLDAQEKANLFSYFAINCNDDELKEELYGEAIVSCGKLSGANRLIAFGPLAERLVFDGKIDVAKELISETWDQPEIQKKQLADSAPKIRIAASRTFAPALGIIDPGAAIDLIRLTALEVEVPGLVAECLVLSSLSGDHDIEAICKQKDVEFFPSQIATMLDVIDLSDNTFQSLVAWMKKQIPAMPDSAAKIDCIMFVARHLPAGPERSKLFELAAVSRKVCNPTYYWDDPAKTILETLPTFESLTTAEFDALLFACLEHAPVKTDTFQLNGVFANVIKMVAVRDSSIAKKMLEPAFANGAWRYGDPTWSAFSENAFVKATAWIDPSYATEKTLELSQQFSKDDPLRKLQLLTTTINELNSIAIGKGMFEQAVLD